MLIAEKILKEMCDFLCCFVSNAQMQQISRTKINNYFYLVCQIIFNKTYATTKHTCILNIRNNIFAYVVANGEKNAAKSINYLHQQHQMVFKTFAEADASHLI